MKRWLRGKAPQSWYNYSRYMILFNRATGVTPDGFLAFAKKADPVEVQDLIDKASDSIPFTSSAFNFKIEMRSFLRTNGYNNLPKQTLTYTLKQWHRGYSREEVKKILGFLDDNLHKLYVMIGVETGFRAKTILAVKYRHISEDFEKGLVPVAVRLGPEFYGKKKSAGFAFLGEQSVALLKECIKRGQVQASPDARLVPRAYPSIIKVLERARKKAGVDPSVQPNHGLRKYFEGALDKSGIDGEVKAVIEGHFDSARSKHYTGREWDSLREVYRQAYPHINVDASNPALEQKLGSFELEKQNLKSEVDSLKDEVRELRDLLRESLKQKAKD